MICPQHGRDLVAQQTEHGLRYHCLERGCTVVCWSGSTSTPADETTRRLRRKCHVLFDALWKPGGKRRKFRCRDSAYHWLASILRLHPDEAHIGMFDREQCLTLLRHLEAT